MTKRKEDDPDEHLLPSATDNTELHDQIETLNASLKAAEEKAQENWDRLLRKEAELQNQQKRAHQDSDTARKNAIRAFAVDLFEVVDSLDQGVNFAQDGKTNAHDLLEGMRLTQKVLHNLLEKHHIKPIEPKPGEPFDPNFQEAISTIATADYPPHCIVDVIQKGYILQNTVIRPARVVVSKEAP
jgi:molecular chaperone GrpE